jgi:hypothetical protein
VAFLQHALPDPPQLGIGRQHARAAAGARRGGGGVALLVVVIGSAATHSVGGYDVLQSERGQRLTMLVFAMATTVERIVVVLPQGGQACELVVGQGGIVRVEEVVVVDAVRAGLCADL